MPKNILALSGKEPREPKSAFLIACEQIQKLANKYLSLNLKVINLEEKLNEISLIPGPKGDPGPKGESIIGPSGENGKDGLSYDQIKFNKMELKVNDLETKVEKLNIKEEVNDRDFEEKLKGLLGYEVKIGRIDV